MLGALTAYDSQEEAFQHYGSLPMPQRERAPRLVHHGGTCTWSVLPTGQGLSTVSARLPYGPVCNKCNRLSRS